MDDDLKNIVFVLLTIANIVSWIWVACCDSSDLLRVVILSAFIFVVTIVWGIIAYTDILEKISEYFKGE